MRVTLLKSSNDKKSFNFFETMGFEVQAIENLEKTDDKLKELIRNDYRTIIMTSEVAGFSENIIKRYKKNEDIKIIIAPSK